MTTNSNTKNNEKTNATMKPATIENLKPFYQDEEMIGVEAKQIKDNKSLFASQIFSRFYPKEEDNRQIIAFIRIKKLICDVDTMHSLLEEAIDLFDSNVNFWCQNPGYIDERMGAIIHNQQLKMLRAHLLDSDLMNSFLDNPAIRTVIPHPNLEKILEDSDIRDSLLKEAVDEELHYSKNDKRTRFVDTEINNDYLRMLIEEANINLIHKVNEQIERNPEFLCCCKGLWLLLQGLIIELYLKGYNKKRTINYIQRLTSIFETETIEEYYDSMIF